MVLITGSSGLVGRELVRMLHEAGGVVRGMDRATNSCEHGQFVLGDLLNAADCRRAVKGVETIVHTAALQHHSGLPRWGRRAFFSANVAMTRNLVAAAIDAGVRRIVFLSSDMVYGVPRGRSFIETDAPQPIGPYGWSKVESERICAAARERGVCVTILRPRLIVGPGRLGVLQKLFDRIRMSRVVPILGQGTQRYQMVSVADVAAACVAAIQTPMDETFNLGSANPPSVRELLGHVIRRAGSASRLVSLPKGPARTALWLLHAVRCAPLSPEQFRIADVDYVLDTEKAGRLLGWRARLADADMLWSAYETYACGLGAVPAGRFAMPRYSGEHSLAGGSTVTPPLRSGL